MLKVAEDAGKDLKEGEALDASDSGCSCGVVVVGRFRTPNRQGLLLNLGCRYKP
jgi:hypothetical protein